MTLEELEELAKQHTEKTGYVWHDDDFIDGFKAALDLLNAALETPNLYTHYDYDEALKPLLDLHQQLLTYRNHGR